MQRLATPFVAAPAGDRRQGSTHLPRPPQLAADHLHRNRRVEAGHLRQGVGLAQGRHVCKLGTPLKGESSAARCGSRNPGTSSLARQASSISLSQRLPCRRASASHSWRPATAGLGGWTAPGPAARRFGGREQKAGWSGLCALSRPPHGDGDWARLRKLINQSLCTPPLARPRAAAAHHAPLCKQGPVRS